MTDATTSPVEEEQDPSSLAVVSTSQAQQSQKLTPALKMPEDILTTEGDKVPSDVDNCQEETPQGTEATFPRFMDLPPEIRTMIWERYTPPRRLVTPWYFSASAPRPGLSSPTARTCREARQVALRDPGLQVKTALRYVYESKDDGEAGGTYKPFNCWYNRNTDLIYLDGHLHNCTAMRMAPLDGSDGNEMARLAVEDTDADLLVAASIGYKFGPPVSGGLYRLFGDWPGESMERVLYERFLKNRAHCFLELWRVDIPLTVPAREEAIRAGLISQDGEQPLPAVIHPDDTRALEKYTRLMDLSPNTRITTNSSGRETTTGIHELVQRGGFKVGTEAQEGMLDFLHCLVYEFCDAATWHVGLDERDILGIADADGNLVKDNQIVLDLKLTLPRWTPVIVFQLLDEESPVDDTAAKEEGEGTNDTEGLAEDADEVMVREEEADEHHTWATAVRKLMRRGEYWFWWPL